MNRRREYPSRKSGGIALALLALALSACGTSAVKDPWADRAQADLIQLQADPRLASRAPAAIKEAEDAVSAAEVPQKDPQLAAHLAYLADRKVRTARKLAEARVAEDQLKALRGE